MRLKTKLVLLGFLVSLGIGLLPAVASHAATGTIYVSPGSMSEEVGGTFSTQVRINPGTSVNAVQATLNYNPSALEWLSNSIGAFSTCTENSGGGGAATFACAMLGSSTSSDSLIATVSFKTLVGSGSTTLSLSNANAADNGTYTNPSTSGATVSFYSPAPAPAPTAGPTKSYSYHSSSSSVATSSSSTPAATPQPSAPAKPATIKINDFTAQFDTASLKVATNVPVQVYLQYGTDKNNLSLSIAPSSLGTSNTVSFDKAELLPGTTYYYQIIAKDASGNITKSPIKSFTTKGYTISITVLDSQNHPLANQPVTLHSTPTNAKTNNQGIATFTNVAPGVHHLLYKAGDKTYSQTVYVSNDFVTKNGKQTAPLQSAAVILNGFVYKSVAPIPGALAFTVLLVVAFGIIVAIVWTSAKARNKNRVYSKQRLLAMRLSHKFRTAGAAVLDKTAAPASHHQFKSR